MRRAYIGWFARNGQYWPHEKRLAQRLADLGGLDLAENDTAVWTSDLAGALAAIREQLRRLSESQPHE
jgi:hypothetical protein